MGNYLVHERIASNDDNHKRIASNDDNRRKQGHANVQFEDLPEDLLCTIFSKLPLREVVRTSALSSKWRRTWMICPKLSFDKVTMLGYSSYLRKEHTRIFIDSVNKVLKQCRGKVVEELLAQFEFDNMLVHHLNSWVSFAVSSRTKYLSLDLSPAHYQGRKDHYKFPFELLDSESISRLQHIKLGFVSFQPPYEFRGFPNLRRLDLHLLRVTGKDLQHVLSNCYSLEVLSMFRCHLKDELKVDCLLDNLQCLLVVECDITKIEFNARKLSTFMYRGWLLPIDLSCSLHLENAYIHVLSIVSQDALLALPKGLPTVQNLTLQLMYQRLQVPTLLESPCMLSKLKHLQLIMVVHCEDIGNMLSLCAFLRETPCVEKLEVHFGGATGFGDNADPPVKCVPSSGYNHLKSVCVTGYGGTTGQLEFLIHVVENAPALEILTVDTAQKLSGGHLLLDLIKQEQFNAFRQAARRHLVHRLPPKANLVLL